MLEQCFKNGAIPAFSNRSGANLLPGITAEYAANASLGGKMRLHYAVIECDEAAFKHVSKYVDAKVVLVTNVFEDQVDRFGDITHTITCIQTGIEQSPNATVCLNGDCPLLLGMMADLDNPVHYYGVETALYGVGTEGSGLVALDVAVTQVLKETPDTSQIEVRVEGELHRVTVNLPGAYNIYNAAGVIAVADVMNLGMSVTSVALAEFRGGFGRMERFAIGDVTARMILVKNAVGCSQALRYVTSQKEPLALVFCLNDRTADGTDISWLWDVDGSLLSEMGDRLVSVYCSGTRVDDLVEWMKSVGVSEAKIQVERDHGKLLEAIAGSDVPVYILPTYTAMLEVRELLVKRYGLQQFWE